MRRRAFLGLLGGAAVSGPTVARAAAADMSSLAIPALAGNPDMSLSAAGARRIGGKDALSGFDGMTPAWQDHYRRLARAAIEAMRDLDLTSINAGQIEMLSEARPSKMDVAEIFRAVLDAALSGEAGT